MRPGFGYCVTCRTKVVYDGYTRAQLSEAFDQVKDLTNWKSPSVTRSVDL